MDENLRLGITGPISEVNFGDYAMFINNIYDINIKDITIFIYNKGFSETIIKDYCDEFNIETVEIKLKQNNSIISDDMESKPKVGFLPFRYPTDTPLDILYRVDNLDEVGNYIDDIDVLIVNGGGYFNHLWNNSLWRSDMLKKIIAPILLASQKHKKIIFTGNSFGPFDQSEEFFTYLFNYLNNVTFAVRDRMYSEKYLKRIGISSDNIHFIPDDLYFINKTILSKPNNIPETILKAGKYIVLELYFPIDELKKCRHELKRFSNSIYERYGLSIIFIPFDFDRGGMWQGEYLKDIMNNFYMYSLNEKGYLPIEDIYNIINNSEMVICTRYHALVLAISSGIPVINIMKKVCDDYRYYFNKNYGLLEYTFDGLMFNEMDFLKIDLVDTLKYLEENFSEIIKKQKELYSSVVYVENVDKLKKCRLKYFDKIYL